jgi:hypothetical protein
MFQWDRLRILHGDTAAGEMMLRGDGIDEGGSAREPPQGCDAVSPEPFSEPVRRLLKEVMTTFERLEVLLFLRKNASDAFTASRIGQSLHVRLDLVAEALEGLAERGLLVRETANGEFRFEPSTAELASVVEELAAAYRDRSAAVLSTMSVNAIERIRSGPVRAFADSFLLGKRKDDG